MAHADYLSRHPLPNLTFAANIINSTEQEWVQAVQSQDEAITNIIFILQTPRSEKNKTYFANYVLKKEL